MLFVSTIYTNQQTICYSLQTMQIAHHTLIISKNYYQSLFICFLVPEKHIIFVKVQRRIKSKNQTFLSFKLQTIGSQSV